MSTSTASPMYLTGSIANEGVVAKVGLAVAGALLTAALAQFEIPMWPVPITGQTLGVLIAGAALGWRLGGMSQLLYLGMGALGAPVFAGGAGSVEHFIGPTVGYLIAFPIAAAMVGWMAQARLDRHVGTAMVTFVIGTIFIFVSGTAGLMAVLGLDLMAAVQVGIVPFIPGAIIKSGIAAVALPLLWRLRA